ncbi:helix-turn-helix transcriptional regulator [Rhodococcus sp. 27YEA15]|uniref:helix-turn-helix transcriptional regulator n=1 Tax=Rhodococcus sp. 27YEA15 TaxID=3156259 RepID=UPI003C7DBE43
MSPSRFLPGEIVDSEIVNLTLVLGGKTVVKHRQRDSVFLPGQINAQVGWNRHDGTHDTDVDLIMLRLDRRSLAERGVRIAAEADGFGPPTATTTTYALSALVKATLHGQALTDARVPAAIESAALELLVGLHLEGLGYEGHSSELDYGLHARAVATIGASYRDPSLTPTAVAERLGVTVRQLQRAFEKVGGTVIREIRHQRAGYAALLLRGGGAAPPPLEELAVRSGFSSVGELRRAVRDRYDLTPSQIRLTGTGTESSPRQVS